MQATDLQFTRLLNGATQFVIPVFQRDYSWSEAQCDQIWADVLRVGVSATEELHFMGSVVYIDSGDSSAGLTRWLLIDGQQRMTTLALLTLALARHLRDVEYKPKTDDDPTPERIEAYFLKNIHEPGTRQFKLMLRRHDQATLAALLKDDDLPADRSKRILENYEFFRDQLKGVDPMVVYRGLGRLVIVDVKLHRGRDDPQMIFESLNSTGMDLSQSDLIRNYILMRLPEGQQTHCYERYWSKIEALFRESDGIFDAFARDYMALMTRASKQIRGNQIYHEFRAFFRERTDSSGLEAALDDMLRFARYHAAFRLGRGAKPALKERLRRLSRHAEVASTLVMKLSDCNERVGSLTDEQFVEALALLESYVIRRAICGMQTRSYWQVFANLAYQLSDDEPLKSLKVGLHLLRETYRFPRDEEFGRELKERDLYGTRICHFVLDTLENHNTKEPTDTSEYSIEHVMPQNSDLSEAWRQMLGPNWEQVQGEWLHRLGNLTLTAYNSTYSDRPFEEKKSIPGGFNESAVRLNRDIREQTQWGVAEIRARGERLATVAIEAWGRLEVSQDDVRAAKARRLLKRAAQRSVAQVPMSQEARDLLEPLRERIQALGEVIEVPESRSVVYFSAESAADFFLEVLPRRRRLVLLLNMSFAECVAPDGRTYDASDQKFFANAKHSGGVYYVLREEAQLDAAMKVVRQAYEQANA